MLTLFCTNHAIGTFGGKDERKGGEKTLAS